MSMDGEPFSYEKCPFITEDVTSSSGSEEQPDSDFIVFIGSLLSVGMMGAYLCVDTTAPPCFSSGLMGDNMTGGCMEEGYMMGRMTGIIPEGECKTGIMAGKGMAITAED